MDTNYAKQLVRRSRLIVPAHIEKFIAKACMRNADVIVLDLEDSVPKNQKELARSHIKDTIAQVGRGGGAVFVRINNESAYWEDDIKAAVWPGLEGLYIPKVENAEQIKKIEQLVTKLERERGLDQGSICLSIIIETCLGYIHMEKIVQASARIDTLTLGNEDFLKDMGAVETAETTAALVMPRLQIVLMARAYGKVPMGLIGSLANYQNEDSFAESAVRAYQLGFLGASCINPKNVEILNKSFSPSDETTAHAEQIKTVFESALAAGKGATVFEGKMIDYAHYNGAITLLERKQIIDAFEAKKSEAISKNIRGAHYE